MSEALSAPVLGIRSPEEKLQRLDPGITDFSEQVRGTADDFAAD